jgi:simple sugar transport system ATP-binding protein
MSNIVEMQEITKNFPGIVANDKVSLELRKGEIHALLGENGAGKSTLMSVLFGMYKPDGGKIFVRGKEVRITDPNMANALGIGMVHQHFKLVHNYTVTENIILGMEKMRGGVVDTKGASQKIKELSEKYGLNVDANAIIENISVGMQQRVEILKMLYRNAEVLIFDEPTAVLTPQEIRELMKIMKNLIEEGHSIILITHKLKEIKEVADRCTILRRGKVVGMVDVASTSESRMAEMMVGREVSFTVEKGEAAPGMPILSINNLNVLNSSKLPAVKNFTMQVHAGEIVGICGVDGNGQTELVEAITGLRKAESGSIYIRDKEITSLPIDERIKSGIAHIPEDRQRRGLVLDMSLEENIVIEIFKSRPMAHKGLLDKSEIRKYATKVMNDFDVRSSEGPVSLTRSMSGGNQQKAIVGREIQLNPELLIAAQPTRGLDVGSIEYIHKRLVEQRDSGKAVLLLSLELDEILNVSDRIVVVNSGEIVGIVNAKETDENQLGLMMAGVRKEA